MDYITDKNPKGLKWVEENLSPPDCVKEASETPSGAFADLTRMEHPIGTPAEAWRSYAYLKTAHVAGDRDQELIRTIKLAGVALGIGDELDKIDAFVASSREKSASDSQPDFALEYSREGEHVKLFPIGDARSLIKSARSLGEQSWKTPLEWFWHASRKIVKRASELGVNPDLIPANVWEHGKDRMVDYDKAMRVARQRAPYVDSESAGLYVDVVKSASVDQERPVKDYIDIFVDLDHLNDIDYKKHINPYQAFYSGDSESDWDKFASSHVLMSDRVFIPVAAFQKVEGKLPVLFGKANGEKIASAFRETGYDGLKLTNLVADLDESDRESLVKLLLACGTEE